MPQAIPGAPSADSSADLSPLPPGTPIDLDNCEREAIQYSGSVQPRGVLFVTTDPGLHVLQVTANVAELIGPAPQDCIEQPLSAAIGERAAAEVRHAISVFGDLRDRNPLELTLDLAGR